MKGNIHYYFNLETVLKTGCFVTYKFQALNSYIAKRECV